MKPKIIITSIAVIAVGLLLYFILKKDKAPAESGIPMHSVKVEEVIQTTQYTYLRVNESGSDYWVAVIQQEIEVGSKWSWSEGTLMNDFPSKELNRTFPSIIFLNEILPESGRKKSNTTPPLQPSKPKPTLDTNVSVDPVPGGVTIATLFKDQASYSEKKITVRGKVVKVNNEVMDRNWVHLQDGTEFSGKFDLTLTTTETVNVGDVVTFEGIVRLNKDFGAGYFYEVIVEEGVKKE